MAKFCANERVLAFHGPLIYEAKILKVSPEGNNKFFIHYHGWNKNWDEWVPEPRILKYTESNLDRKKELIKAHDANVKAKKQAVTTAHKRKAPDAPASGAPPDGGPAGDSAAAPPPPPSEAAATDKDDGPSASKSMKRDDDQPVEAAAVEAKEAESKAPTPPSSSTAASQQQPAAPTGGTVTLQLEKNLPDVCLVNAPPSTSGKKKPEVSVSVKASSSATNSNAGAPTVDKPPTDNTVETEDQFYTKVEIRIRIPDELKPYLVDDWDYLTRQRKLVILPATLTVDQIIQDYIKYKKAGSNKRNNGNGRESAVLEVTSGLKEYFNVMLGSQLLYKFEREQHSDIIKQHPDLQMCKIYGAIHFLRLFVKLGAMLTYTPLDEKSVQLLLFYINDFLGYMKKNASTLFTIGDYGTAPPEYHRRAL